ncbi:hypothetical protein [Pararhizobium sp.]|uniref:hypothetical protein n=1 Tax=Pararhizobium sp. TaxID=1977563 RepID=UPI00271999ED|nr:hypothetical protein [Pararhizobium sp.]MDO9418741.1 hypothetical protein [Pararhizobium sp.]
MTAIKEALPSERYLNRNIACENALESAFENLAAMAHGAGWSRQEVAAALLNLGDRHLLTLMDEPQQTKRPVSQRA